jgi:hypothetical protein
MHLGAAGVALGARYQPIAASGTVGAIFCSHWGCGDRHFGGGWAVALCFGRTIACSVSCGIGGPWMFWADAIVGGCDRVWIIGLWNCIDATLGLLVQHGNFIEREYDGIPYRLF